jgi:hypothetical protein
MAAQADNRPLRTTLATASRRCNVMEVLIPDTG